MSKKFRCALLAGALSAVVAFSAGFSACNIKTSHPRAKITVDFNNISYDIEYIFSLSSCYEAIGNTSFF